MKPKFLLVCVCLSLLACNTDMNRPQRAAMGIFPVQDAETRKVDSFVSILFDSLRIPLVKRAEHETYLFLWFRRWGQSYVYTVERYNDNITLRTKCIDGFTNGNTVHVYYKNRSLYLNKPAIIDSSTQVLKNNEYDSFKNLLDGSYYWLLNSTPRYDGILDGDVFLLQSKSKIYKDSLEYHSVRIHAPHDGSFEAACTYLTRLSNLTKQLETGTR